MINIFQNDKYKFDNFIYICFILLPIFLISGPLLPESVVVLISIYAIFKIVKSKEYRFFLKNKYFLFFLLFWINSFLVSSFNYFEMPKDIRNLASIINSFFYFRYLFFTIGIIIILSENKELLKTFFLICLFCLTILFIDGIYQFLNDVNIFGYEISQDKRVSSFFGDELVLGSYTLRILIIIIPILFLVEKKFKLVKYFFFILISISFGLIVISGERTAFLLYFLAIFFYFIFRILTNKQIVAAILIIIFSLAFSLNFENINKRLIDRTIMEANNFQTINEKFTTGFFGQQILYYATAINISKEYPIGVGNKNFKLYCGEYRADKYRSIENTQSCSTIL